MPYVLGTDTSHWSGNIDFAKMHAAGAGTMDVILEIWGYWL